MRGIPLSRLSDTFGNFDLRRNPTMSDAMAMCRRVVNLEVWCAFLVGEYGTGKTHLAIAALNDWGGSGVPASQRTGYFWKVPDFMAWIKDRVFEDHEPIDNVLRSYREGGALIVFDDLGAENQTDWAAEQLYRVLDSRYESKLPTIVTSNREPSQLDPRLNSRFRAGLVACIGTDVRETDR